MNIVSYSDLRSNLKNFLDSMADRHERLVVSRPNGEHVIMMSLKDYEAECETNYLLSSPANRAWLNASIEELKKGQVKERKLLDDE